MKKTIRFFKKSEKEILLKAIDQLWARDHIYVRNPAVLEHMVLYTPWKNELAGEDEYAFVGMWIDDELVGIQGFMPQEANVFGKLVKAQTGTIWIVKKTKGKSINGMDMIEYAKSIRPTDFRIGLGMSKFTEKIHRLQNDYVTKNLNRWIIIIRPDLAKREILSKVYITDLLPIYRERIIRNRLRVKIDLLSQPQWDEFYYKKVAPLTIGICRDYKFLKWRYMDSPVLKYHFLTVTNEADMYLGLAVVRIEHIRNSEYTVGRILEFISFDISASATLAEAIIQFDKNVLMWDFYCLSDVASYGLETVGFQKIPEWCDDFVVPTRYQPVDYEHLKINVGIYTSDDIKQKINPLSHYQWYVTRGDADQDRAN